MESYSPSDVFLPNIRGHQEEVNHYLRDKIPGWKHDNGITTWHNRIWVPDNNDLRAKIIEANHDNLTAGHPGRFRTMELIQRDYWWPSISRDVQRYVSGCTTCQKSKILRNKPQGLLAPHSVPDGPWDIISADLIVDLPKSRNYDAIFVVVDRLSKMVRTIPTTKSVTAEGLAKLYRNYVWKDFGLPSKIISDRASTFTSKFMTELNRLLGIQTNISSAYHPQTDGQTERLNQEVEQYLRLFVNEQQNNWSEWLPCAEFTINNRVNSSTGFSPFFINYGRHPHRPLQPNRKTDSRVPQATSFAQQMKHLHNETQASLQLTSNKMKEIYDRKRLDQRFAPGDQVLLDASDILSSRPSKKLDNLRYGPFMVTACIGEQSYRLRLPPSWKIHDVFHVSKLSRFIPTSFENQSSATTTDPIPITETTTPIPEQILDHRRLRNGTLFLVQWKDCPPEDSSWQHETELDPHDKLLATYKQTNGLI